MASGLCSLELRALGFRVWGFGVEDSGVEGLGLVGSEAYCLGSLGFSRRDLEVQQRGLGALMFWWDFRALRICALAIWGEVDQKACMG